MYHFKGKARVFNSMEETDEAVSQGLVAPGSVIVIRYEGPKGGPGMREMLSTTSLIMGRGMDEEVALVTDGRFSGATHGPCIGHISPEAAAGGQSDWWKMAMRSRSTLKTERWIFMCPKKS